MFGSDVVFVFHIKPKLPVIIYNSFIPKITCNVPVVEVSIKSPNQTKICYDVFKSKMMKMTNSNLSKVKPAFRTKGNVTGNFGAPKRTKEAYNTGIGVTNAKVVNITTTNDYLTKMYYVLDNATDSKMKQFAYNEIKSILIKQGKW